MDQYAAGNTQSGKLMACSYRKMVYPFCNKNFKLEINTNAFLQSAINFYRAIQWEKQFIMIWLCFHSIVMVISRGDYDKPFRGMEITSFAGALSETAHWIPENQIFGRSTQNILFVLPTYLNRHKLFVKSCV